MSNQHHSGTNNELAQHLRSRSAEEVLGPVAKGTLPRDVSLATAGTLILMLVLSVVPYALRGHAADKPAVQAEDPATKVETPATKAAPPAAVPGTPATAPAPAAVATTPDKPAGKNDAVLDKLGMDTKKSDPKANPLDKSADDLLKDLK
jgi:hypothetical protein